MMDSLRLWYRVFLLAMVIQIFYWVLKIYYTLEG